MRVHELITRVLAFGGPLLLLGFIFEFGMYRTGESWPVQKVAHLQSTQEQVLYGRKYFTQEFDYLKYLLIKTKKPDILVLGSSRVMQIRDFMFKPLDTCFYNGGGLVGSVEDLVHYCDAVKGGVLPTPKVLILGIDPWWFKKGWRPKPGNWFSQSYFSQAALTPAAHVQAARTLIVRFNLPWSMALKGVPANSPYDKVPAVGAAAISHGRGFRCDGSRQYDPAVILDFLKNPVYTDREQPPVIQRIRNKSHQFELPATIDSTRVKVCLNLLQSIIDMGIEAYIFLPPFSNEAIQELEFSDEFSDWGYGGSLENLLRQSGVPFITVTCPSDFGFNDTYMWDGFHGSEVLMAHIVKSFFEIIPQTGFLRRIQAGQLDSLINLPDIVPLSFKIPPIINNFQK